MCIELIRADERDADALWRMQKTAFAELLQKYRDFETSPANEPLEKVLMRLRQPFTYFYFITFDGVRVGAIRVVDKKVKNEAKHISPLFILPQYRNRGFAQRAILQAEHIHGDGDWELDTILQEAANCHLYEKMGYRRTEAMKIINDKLTLIYYKK